MSALPDGIRSASISNTRGSAQWALPLFVPWPRQRPGERGSRPRPLRWAASHPPLAACGPLSLPTLGGGVAPPAPPADAVGVMWRPRPRLRRVPAKLAASRCAGAPLRKARPRQAACGGPCFAPPPRRLRRRCSGAARPPQVGAVGPSAPPARSAALRPPPRLRHACGAGSALGGLPAHSPPGVAARRPSLPTAAKPGRRLRPAALPLRGAAISTPRAGAAQVRPFRALRAAGARGTPAAAGTATPLHAHQGQAPVGCGCAAALTGDQRRGKERTRRRAALWRLPAHFSLLRGFLCSLLRSASRPALCRSGWLRPLVRLSFLLCSRCPVPGAASGRLRQQRQRQPVPLWLRLLCLPGGSPLSAAGSGKRKNPCR